MWRFFVDVMFDFMLLSTFLSFFYRLFIAHANAMKILMTQNAKVCNGWHFIGFFTAISILYGDKFTIADYALFKQRNSLSPRCTEMAGDEKLM